MSAGLCALFLRLPQLPSVEANAASNWATGRAWRGWAGHSAGCRWLPEMDWQAPLLEDPRRGRAVEGDARSGQQEWPLASVFTMAEGTKSKKT